MVYICSGPKKGGQAVETTPGYILIVLFNNRSAASATRPQSVGGNCSPESALKPSCRHTYYLQLKQFHITKLLSPGPTAHEPEHQRPRYQLHSIMSIRLASHYIFTSPSFYHIYLNTSHLTFYVISG